MVFAYMLNYIYNFNFLYMMTMFKNIKKRWKVEYYRYNLTERVEECYYTEFFAALRGFWVNRRTGFKVWVKKV